MPDIVLFGATGYTGRLTAHALARRGARFAIAGRNGAKLEQLAAATGGPDIRVADVGDVEKLTSAIEDAKVLITCVGPFVELGGAAVEAALRARVHYIDSTGEGAFIERLIARDTSARSAGIAMAPAMGFDEVPADSAATIATEGMADADLVLTYALPSTGSRGTVRSALGIATTRAAWLQDGRRHDEAAGAVSRWSPMPPPLGPKPAMSFPLAEAHLAPRHLSLRSLETYVTTDPIQRTLLKTGLPALRLALSTRLGKAAAETVLGRLPEGPDDEQRRGRWTILAEARAGAKWRNVAITGRDVYGLTAEFLSAGAVAMTEETFDVTGVVSPVEAVGIERWRKEFVDHDVVVETFEDR